MANKKVLKLRAQAFNRQGGRCFYCGVSMWTDDAHRFARRHRLTIGEASPLKCTAEHLQARADGGADTSNNIVAACLLCNRRRHQSREPRQPPDYRQHVRRRVQAQRWHSASVFRAGVANAEPRAP